MPSQALSFGISLIISTLGLGCEQDPPANSDSRMIRLVSAAAEGEVEWEVESSWDPKARREGSPSDGLSPQILETFDQQSALETWDRAQTVSEFPTLGSNQIGDRPLAPPTVVGGRLRFSPPEGALFRVLLAPSDSPFEIRARGRGPEEKDAVATLATVMVLELRRKGPLSDPPSTDLEDWVVVNQHAPHILPFAHGNPELLEQSLVFKTSVYTEALMVCVLGGVPGQRGEGEVLFDDIGLTPLNDRAYRPFLRDSQSDDLVDPFPTHDFMGLVKLLGEVRPAFLTPPETTLRLGLSLPHSRPELVFAHGILDENTPDFGRAPIHFSVRVAKKGSPPQTLFERSLDPQQGVEAWGWHRAHVDLSSFAGQDIDLEFIATSEGKSLDMAAFGSPMIRPRFDTPPKSVILVSLDTLRADHLGLYGYERPTSPFIDSFFSTQGLSVSDFVASSSYTLPTHASIFTGQDPSVHGVKQGNFRLDRAHHPHLAQLLADQGYTTIGRTGGGFVGYEYGFHHGFDHYSIIDPLMMEKDPYRDRFPREGDRPFNDKVYDRYRWEKALDELSALQESPHFVFLHSFVVHNYSPPNELAALFDKGNESDLPQNFRLHDIDKDEAQRARFDDVDLQHAINLYDATIRVADQAIEKLVKRLEELEVLDHTILIVLSDHGEEFQEHGGLLHGRTLFQEQIHVPFLAHIPGLDRTGRINAIARHIDVAPTILQALDLEQDWRMQGQELLSPLRGRASFPNQALSELNAESYGEIVAWREGALKTIWTPSIDKVDPAFVYRSRKGLSLFDLNQDPQEFEDLSNQRPNARRQLQDQMQNRLKENVKNQEVLAGGGAEEFQVSETTQKLLEMLGYTQTNSEEK